MKHKPSLADLLAPYGIKTLDDFQAVISSRSVEHARAVYGGKRPLSKKAALALKEYTRGELSVDLLFSLSKQYGQ